MIRANEKVLTGYGYLAFLLYAKIEFNAGVLYITPDGSPGEAKD